MESDEEIEPVQYYNLLLYKHFYDAILKSNPLTPYKMGVLGFSEPRNVKK